MNVRTLGTATGYALLGCLVIANAFLWKKQGALQEKRETLSTTAPRKAGTDHSAPKDAGTANRRGSADDQQRAGYAVKESEAEWLNQARQMRYDTRKAEALSERVRIRLQFGQLYAKLGLSRTEAAKFEDLAGEMGLNFYELVGQDEDRRRRWHLAQLGKLEQTVAQSLGADYVPAFRQYAAESDVRRVVDDIAIGAFSSSPLSGEQSEQLMAVCLALRQNTSETGRISAEEIDWKQVSERSKQFLNADQQKVLDAVLSRRTFDRDFRNLTGLPLRRPVRGI